MSDIDLPDLTARLRLDTSELEGAVKKASGIGSAVGSAVGNLASGGISSAVGAITEFASGSVDAFAQLEDATAAAGVLFGDNVGAITTAAEQAASRVGLSSQAYIDAAGTIGTFGQAAGLQGKPLTDFTTKLADLSGDLASFKGTSTEQAVEAVGAALRGESEPIRAYGVLLDEATINAEALSMGLVKSERDTTKVASARAALTQAQERLNKVEHDSKATAGDRAAAAAAVGRAQASLAAATKGTVPQLTKQQKLLATQSAILKQTSNAQGDFGRTSTSTANTQKRLAAEADNAQAALGARLAPALTAVRMAVLGVVTGLADFFDWVQRNILVIGTITAFIAAATLALTAHSIAVKVVSGVTRAWTAVQAALNFVMSANPIGLVVIAIAALVAAFVIAYNRSDRFRAIVQSAMAGIRVAITSAMNAGRVVVASVMAFIHGNVSGNLGRVRAVVGAVFGFVVSFIRGQLAAVRAIISGVLNVVVGLFTGDFGRAKQGAITALGGLLRYVSTVPNLILRGLGNLGSLLLDSGAKLIQGLADGIMGRIESVKRAAGRVAQAVKDFFPGSPVKEGPLTSWNGGGAGRRLGSMLAGGLDSARSAVAAASNRVAAAVAQPAMQLGQLGAGGAAAARAAAASAVVHVAAPLVRVFIGDRELTDLVRTEVDTGLVGAARAITNGAS